MSNTVPNSAASCEMPLDPGDYKLTPMGLKDRTREAFRSAFHILRTGEHEVANALAEGIGLGMDSGFAAALGEFNAALVAQGIDPVRKPR